MQPRERGGNPWCALLAAHEKRRATQEMRGRDATTGRTGLAPQAAASMLQRHRPCIAQPSRARGLPIDASMNHAHSSPRSAAMRDERPQTIAGIGLELLGYARVAELLHRVAIAEQKRGDAPADATRASASPAGASMAHDDRVMQERPAGMGRPGFVASHLSAHLFKLQAPRPRGAA